MSEFLQTTLVSEAHLTEGHLLTEEQVLNIEASTEQELEDQQFPKEKDRIQNEAKPE
jgi:hypothetical protein